MTDRQKPEISASTLKGDVRDFLLTWIQSMDTPFHKMTERSQKDVIWAAEMQAHNLIGAITMAIAGRGFEKAFVRISDFAIKDGVVSKVTADSTQTTVLNFLAFKGKAAVLVFADPAVYAAERRPAKYFPDEPTLPGVADEPEPDEPQPGGPGHGIRVSDLKGGDTSKPAGPLPSVRIPQAFIGDQPEDPIEHDLWRDRNGDVWGFKNGKWVDPKGNERPEEITPKPNETGPSASQAAEGAEGSQKPAPERRRLVGPMTLWDPVPGDVWVPKADGSGPAFTLQDNGVWVDLATGEIYSPPPSPPLAKPDADELLGLDKPKPKTKKVDKPAAPGTADYIDPVTGKKFADPGEPDEVTEDSGQPIITKSTGEPNVAEDEA